MASTMPDMPQSPRAADKPIRPDVPWAMEAMQPPMSHDTKNSNSISIDEAMDKFRHLGVNREASITLPQGSEGAYVATWEPDHVQDTRVVYLDQYSGAVIGDVGFKDWGPVGKAVEWGIAVHQGQEYGPLNRYVMLLGCIAIVLMSVSAIIMWWKRRPAGSLGIPRPPVQTGAIRGLVIIMTIVGGIFPLVGASLLVAFGIDRAVLLVNRR